MSQSFREQIILFLHNPIFLSCVFSWLGAQFIKTIINLIHGRIHSFSELVQNLFWKTGGMPSSHSALVASICTTIGFRNGINSDLFMLCLVVFFVTIRDAFGVRHSSGIQAHKLNELGKELAENKTIEKYKPIKEVDGHTPLQVIMGCVLGFLIGLSFSLLM